MMMFKRRYFQKKVRDALVMAAITLTASGAALAGDGGDSGDSFDLLGFFPTTELQKRLKAYQFRLNLFWGSQLTTFSSRAHVSGVRYNLDTGATDQKGFRMELERWFQAGTDGRRPLGMILELQQLYIGDNSGLTGNGFAQLPGEPIAYTSGSVMLGWRALGYGQIKLWKPELTLFAGPGVERFPALELIGPAANPTGYNLTNPTVLGTRSGFRMRTPLVWEVSGEVGAYYVFPHRLVGAQGSRTLVVDETHTWGGSAVVDFNLNDRLVVGGGFYFGRFELQFEGSNPAENDRISLWTQSFAGNIRFNF